MKKISLLLLLALAAPLALASEPETGGESKPGFFQRLNPFRKKNGAPVLAASNTTHWEGFEFTLLAEPATIKLAETRAITVKLQLVNRSKKLRQLQFPTTQRFEVTLRSQDSKLVEQWSEDHAFDADPGMVTINPGERLEYTATVATRDLVAGQTYVLEAFFPNYESLRVQTLVRPE